MTKPIHYCGAALFYIATLLNSRGLASHSYTNIADSTMNAPAGKFNSFFHEPAMSSGVVAFRAAYNNDSGKGVFAGSGSAIVTIAKSGDSAPFGTFIDFGLRGPAISNGTVAFYGRYANASNFADGIFTGSGASKTTVAKTGDPAPYGNYTTLQGVAITGSTVAFEAGYFRTGDISSSRGVFARTSGITATYATLAGDAPKRTYSQMGRPAVSGSTVAFFGTFAGESGFGQGIFKDSGGVTTTIAKSGDAAPAGTFGGFSNSPAISGDTVAFVGNFGNGGQGVFTSSGGALTTIAKKGDATGQGTSFSSFGLNASIAADRTAFIGIDANGRSGIYVGGNGKITNVIKGGDVLFGSTVLDLGLGTFSLDDDASGRIAFQYRLFNGRSGVAMATPINSKAGDYDGDGDADGADFLAWQRQYGSLVSPGTGADGDWDGRIDVGDMGVWKKDMVEKSDGSAGLAVPESNGPAAALICWLGLSAVRWEF